MAIFGLNFVFVTIVAVSILIMLAILLLTERAVDKKVQELENYRTDSFV